MNIGEYIFLVTPDPIPADAIAGITSYGEHPAHIVLRRKVSATGDSGTDFKIVLKDDSEFLWDLFHSSVTRNGGIVDLKGNKKLKKVAK